MPTSTDKSKSKAPALDLSALTVTEAEVPKQTRERKHKDNPFTAWLAESYENKTGRSVSVPNANAGEVEYLIRRASNDLGIGARVVVTKDSPKKGTTTVLFAGKDRKARKPKGTDAATAAPSESA